MRFFRRQQLYVFTAVAVMGVFWATRQQINPATVIVYSLCIGNLLTPPLERTHRLYAGRRFPYNWAIFLALLVVFAFPVYVLSTLAVWWLAPPSPQSLAHLLSAWEFPWLVTMIFGIVSFVYNETKTRLEVRNLQLQQAMDQRVAQVELQEQELQRALEIQRSLLPREIPQVPGFEVAGAWQPARVVGGDYFDVLKLSDSRLAICIADVVGKSVSAALLMANLQAAVHAFAQGPHTPSWLCSRVNLVLCSNIASDKFVTFFYGILDAESRRFEYCNAGHLPPVLVGATGSVRHPGGGGAVLGVFRDSEYQDSQIDLQSGDRLLLFTDGLTEAFSPDGQEFGEHRIAATASAHRKLRAQELNRLLLAEVGKFCGAQFHDDATLLVVAATTDTREESLLRAPGGHTAG